MTRRRRSRGQMQLNPQDLMRQMQKVQEQMSQIQEETEQEVITVTSGGGMVEVAINGALEIQGINIKPEVVDPEDVEMLEDLVLAAVNEAVQKAQDLMSDKMEGLTGGLNIPGL